MTSAWPGWLADLRSTLPVTVHYLLTGNVEDRYLVPGANGEPETVAMIEALWRRLRTEGFEALLVHDPVDHVRVYPDTKEALDAANDVAGFRGAGPHEVSLERLAEVMRSVVGSKQHRIALVLDSASRTVGTEGPGRERLLLTAAREAAVATPMVRPGARPVPLHNPVIWLLGSARDVPTWLVDKETVRALPVPVPDLDERIRAASLLARAHGDLSEDSRGDFVDRFAESSVGMTLRSMIDVMRLAADRETRPEDIDSAVRAYRVGVAENPWKRPFLRERIARGDVELNAQVLGQERAVRKALDILVRSTTGLTAAHSRGHAARPRGVLFFAGPTGVGKTELAKAITKLVFGDESAYSRFDMSEYSSEHNEARLIGAPPGYSGHDAGGQLTDAIERNPFSLVLFDEIEKAHPRILDKFLQILEDGRLTDGNGRTVYFSESLIVFTSNLGIWTVGEDGSRVPNVTPGTTDIESTVRTAIETYFTRTLGRPELLNRIGLDNVVVFDFISEPIARRLVSSYVGNVLARVAAETGHELTIDPDVEQALEDAAVQDLSMGGRGVGAKVENLLVNPLARALFSIEAPQGTPLRVVRIEPGNVVLEVA